MMNQQNPADDPLFGSRRTFLRLGGALVIAPLAVAATSRPAAAGATAPSVRTTGVTGTAGASTAFLVSMEKASPADRVLMEGLPVGNGRLGGLVGGGAVEQLALNEDSLWAGGANPSGNYDTMGGYKMLGTVSVDLGHDEKLMSDYRRVLDLATGVVTVSYRYQGALWTRQIFASYPDQVIVMTISTTAKQAITGKVTVTDGGGRTPTSLVVQPGQLKIAGTIGNDGVKYGWYARVDAADAKRVYATPATSSTSFSQASSLTVIVGGRTNYSPNGATGYRSTEDPQRGAIADVVGAVSRTATQLRARHVADYQSLFNRQSIDLGASTTAQLAAPTFQRVIDNQTTPDPQLYSLYYQFARYLTISSTRPGSLPMNLQGVWNNSDNPPWNCDYHNDINVQMCYWLSDPAGLSETVDPLVEFLISQLPAWRKATQAAVHKPGSSDPVRGWTVRVSNNISGGMGWEWMATGSAWLGWHLWDHYTYTLDKNYLRAKAYPVLKEICQYLQDILVDDGKGKLIVPNSWSPEHVVGTPWRNTDIGFRPIEMGPFEDGVSMDSELAWDAFSNFIDASTVLGLDRAYRAEITALRDKLHVPAIGNWGQLQEWYPDKDSQTDTHRHLSHLVGVFPGRQITAAGTPALWKAAQVSLTARGTGPTGWSAAWNSNLWATFGNGDKALAALGNLTQPVTSDHSGVEMNYHGGVYPNLFDAHPPFQIDGNIGGAHAIIQMLVQSTIRSISLLPALPQKWAAGSMTGIRARGGFSVDVSWAAGKLGRATVRSTAGAKSAVSYGGKTVQIAIPKGSWVTYDASLKVIASGKG